MKRCKSLYIQATHRKVNAGYFISTHLAMDAHDVHRIVLLGYNEFFWGGVHNNE